MKEIGSTSEKRKYPRQLYPEGKSPLQRRSMHHNCQLGSFCIMKDYIGDDVYADIRDNSQVGVFLKLMESGYVWCAKTVHHFLTHQLAIDRRYEIWCLIEGSPLRFSLYEFAHITGLNCDTIESVENAEVDHREFWGDLKVDPGDGPNWNELVDAIRRSRGWSPEKRKMLGLLFMVHVGIMGLSRSSRVPLEYAKRVFNVEEFEKYPWGRVGFKCLVESLKVVSYEKEGYATHGCVHVLYIWVLESVKVLGTRHGNKIEGENVPLLSWNGGRKRYSIGDFLATEKRKKKKLEVRHLIPKPLEEIYPIWPDEKTAYGEGDGPNKLLDNLLHDIFHDCLDETAWDDDDDGARDGKKMKKKEKRKKGRESSDDEIEDSPPSKKVKKKSDEISTSEKKSKGEKMKEKARNEEDTCDIAAGSVGVFVKMLDALAVKMETMDSNIGNKMELLTKSIDGVDKRLNDLENDVKELKTKDRTTERDDDESSTGGDDESESKMKNTFEPGYRISCLVRNPKAKQKGRKARTMKKDTSGAVESVKRRDLGPNGRPIKKEPTDAEQSVKQMDSKRQARPVVVDLSGEGNGGGEESNMSEMSDSVRRERNKTLSKALDRLFTLATKDDYIPRKGRPLHLSTNQLDPFEGSSIVRRIIEGVQISEAAYDPFAKVEAEKAEKLKAFLMNELENDNGKRNSDLDFYLRMMTPKEMWPRDDKEYGWLGDSHLASAMHMLRQRSMQSVCPFVTNKIAFIDPWFVNQWLRDYQTFATSTKWVFPDAYFDLYKGKSPPYYKTNKKWVEDVDFLYLIHNIENEHWVAVQVDLKLRKVRVYDSIKTYRSDDAVEKSCKPYTKMIPMLMHAVATPAKKKEIGTAAFKFYRMKTCPQNIQEGDCGVYALKYIECLALGISFEGLCDAAMPAIRLKLASEIFDEVPDDGCIRQCMSN